MDVLHKSVSFIDTDDDGTVDTVVQRPTDASPGIHVQSNVCVVYGLHCGAQRS